MAAEPYRPLFALGIFNGLLGVSLWLLYFAGFGSYPLIPHSHIMLLGFFLAFVSGFLMTALPRMSGTAPATAAELGTALILVAAGVVLSLSGQAAASYACSFLQFLFLLFFMARRFRVRRQNPPAGFLFVPAALLWGLFGAAIHVLHFFPLEIPRTLLLLARVGLQEAFLLNLIVGLGGRLIPFLTHVQNVSPTDVSGEDVRPVFAVFAVLNLSLLFEGAGFLRTGWALRALVLAAAAVVMFKVHRPSQVASHLALGLRASVAMMIAGYALLPFLQAYQLALLHLVFIGGFSLITLMVGTRVILAHGGFSLDIERKSWWIIVPAVLLVVASVVRGFYFVPAAATLWLLALALWFFSIGRLVLK